MLFKTCTYYLLESLVQVFKKTHSNQLLGKIFLNFGGFSVCSAPLIHQISRLVSKRELSKIWGENWVFFLKYPIFIFYSELLIWQNHFRFIFNEWYYTTTYYVDIVFHTYDAKLPTFTLSNLEKKTTKQFQNTAHKHPIAFSMTIENALLDTLMYWKIPSYTYYTKYITKNMTNTKTWKIYTTVWRPNCTK